MRVLVLFYKIYFLIKNNKFERIKQSFIVILFGVFVLSCQKFEKNNGQYDLLRNNSISFQSISDCSNNSLIDQLENVNVFFPGCDPNFDSNFYNVFAYKFANFNFEGYYCSQQYSLFKEIVSRGRNIIPNLLHHMNDSKKSKLKIDIIGNALRLTQFKVEYEYKELKLKYQNEKINEINSASYCITVGDLCFFLLGQIVNRDYKIVYYEPTGCAYINSPSVDPYILKQIMIDWSDFDENSQKEQLLADYKYFAGSRKIETLNRILIYFPNLIIDKNFDFE